MYWQQNETQITHIYAHTQRKAMKVSRITTHKNKVKMINAMIASDYRVARACRMIGLNPSTHYRWLKKDKNYAADSQQAFAREEKRQQRLYERWQAKMNKDWEESLYNFWKF